MANPYVELLRTPGTLAFSAAGFLARLPISMIGIGLVLLVSNETGSYTTAGAVAATFSLASAVGAPQVARYVDRHGQRRVGLPCAAVHVISLIALVACSHYRLQTWTLFVAAAVAGAFQPAIGSYVRARWAVIYGGTPQLRLAYSYESVVDELIFVVGPPLVTFVAVGFGAEPALFATALFVAVGSSLLLAQRGTEPAIHHADHAAGRPAILEHGLQVVLLGGAALGGVFGAVEIVTVAFAKEQGHPAAAGVVLALYSLGSLLAGLAYGLAHIRLALRRQFLLGCIAMGLTVVAMPFCGSIPVLAAVAFVAGFAISPTLIAAITLVEDLVPARQLTEGLTWATTGISAGVAAGASIAGKVIDASGASDAYWVAAAFGWLAAGIALLGQPALKRRVPVVSDA